MTHYRTTGKKSKLCTQIGTFLVGSIALAVTSPAVAQSVQETAETELGSTRTSDPWVLPTGPRLPGSNQAQPTARRVTTSPTQEAAPRLADRNAQQTAQRTLADGPISDEDGFTRANTSASPQQLGNRVPEAADEFGASGFRLGTFNATASLEQALGHSSNISGNANGESGSFSQTDLSLRLTSDWSRHQLETTINGSWRKPFDSEEIDQPGLQLNSALRLDLIDGVTVTTSGFYTLETQSFTSTTLAPGAIDNPQIHRFGGAIEAERSDRKLRYSLRGSIARGVFDDAKVGGGLTVSQEDRNNTDYGVTARLGYEISEAVVPFVEAGYTARVFDLSTDRNGNRRDSDIYELRSGVELDFGEKLRGEIAAGVVSEQFEDPSLEDLDGFSLEGELTWSPYRETEIRLALGTETNSSINANENGSILYTGRVELERQMSARLSANAFAGLEAETNQANNRTTEVGVGLQYWINRFTALTADLEYSKFSSDVAGSDFDELSGRVGVRLQR